MQQKSLAAFFLCLALIPLLVPVPARAIFDGGGWVLNEPGTHFGIVFAESLPSFPPEGDETFWDSEEGTCVNGLQEVDQLPAKGVVQPDIVMQLAGDYTFMEGPASHPGQQIIFKYFPGVVCMMTFVFWIYCGFDLCPVVFPLPFFFAPLIIYNGSDI